MKYPQTMFVVGKFVGVHPIKEVSSDFFTQDFAVDTEEQFNNIKVLQATKTAVTDLISELPKFGKGDVVKVSFNLRSTKSKEGKWFTNLTAWKIQPFVPQDTSDFEQPRGNEFPVATAADPQYTGNSAQAAAVPAGSGMNDLPF